MVVAPLNDERSLHFNVREYVEFLEMEAVTRNAGKNIFASIKKDTHGNIVPCSRINGYPCSLKTHFAFLEKYDILPPEQRTKRWFENGNLIVEDPITKIKKTYNW